MVPLHYTLRTTLHHTITNINLLTGMMRFSVDYKLIRYSLNIYQIVFSEHVNGPPARQTKDILKRHLSEEGK